MFKIKNGFTLIESMIVLGIAGTASAAVISNQIDESKKNDGINFIHEVKNIVHGVDRRISIDGYGISDWNTTIWSNEREIVENLIKKELTSSKLDHCSGGTWNPKITSEEKAQLVPCDLWKTRKNNGLNMKAEIIPDTLGFINSFQLTISFEDKESFSNNFNYLKNGIKKLNNKDVRELTGMHTFDLKSKVSNSLVSTSECIQLAENCEIEFRMERAGGSEYIRADGQNSFINTNITFVESKGQSPFKCLRWKNTKEDGTGTWSIKSSDLDYCGVGIYKETNHPAIVDVIGNTGTFQNLLLNDNCNVFKKLGNNVIPDGTSPCGMLNNGEIIQVVENIHAKKALIEEGNFNLTNTNALVSENISTKTLEVKGLSKLFDLETSGELTIGGNAVFKGDLKVLEHLTVEKSTTLKGTLSAVDINIKGSAKIGKGIFVTGDSNINGRLNVRDRISSREGNFHNINNQFAQNSDKNNNQDHQINIINSKISSINSTVSNISNGSSVDRNYCNRLGVLNTTSEYGCNGYKKEGNKRTYTQFYYYWNSSLNQCLLAKKVWTTGSCWREHK